MGRCGASVAVGHYHWTLRRRRSLLCRMGRLELQQRRHGTDPLLLGQEESHVVICFHADVYLRQPVSHIFRPAHIFPGR